MVFEIRTYAVRGGEAPRVAQLLQATVAPLFDEIGVDVVVVGPSQSPAADSAYLVLAHRRAADVDAATERVEGLAEWHDGRREELVALVSSEHRVVVPRAALVGLGARM